MFFDDLGKGRGMEGVEGRSKRAGIWMHEANSLHCTADANTL